ncbi:hypothetical protein EYC58_03445 [Candidatus Saccharibacteria bacterium]|nr:MAG: hypothetical protein EYC58_03445 [Candidatus Saccharibacteria bacterium]
MAERDDFAAWATEIVPREFLVTRSSIETAQVLQRDIFVRSWEDQFTTGINALRVLSEVHDDVTGRRLFLSVMSAMAIFEAEVGPGTAFRYGAMRLRGTAGHYTLSTHDDQCTLMLQIFEPTQISVENDKDRIRVPRLPVPLSVPVMSIESFIDAA